MTKHLYRIPRTSVGTPLFFEDLPSDAVRGRLFFLMAYPSTSQSFTAYAFHLTVRGFYEDIRDGETYTPYGSSDTIVSYSHDPQNSQDYSGSIELPDLLYPKVQVEADVDSPGSAIYQFGILKLWLVYER